LLDTHVLLWSVHQADRLDAPTRDILENPSNDVFFSAASIWEIAIKVRLDRVEFGYRLAEYTELVTQLG
jgi:PIN domain nuclease of toxin-antitoxin system